MDEPLEINKTTFLINQNYFWKSLNITSFKQTQSTQDNWVINFGYQYNLQSNVLSLTVYEDAVFVGEKNGDKMSFQIDSIGLIF